MIAWLDSLRADAIFGWRQLNKHKTTSAAVILSLGLAIGACTAAFRLFDALFLKPLPISDPKRLYTSSRSEGGFGDGWEYMRFLNMRAAMKGEADLIAVSFPEQTDLCVFRNRECVWAIRFGMDVSLLRTPARIGALAE